MMVGPLARRSEGWLRVGAAITAMGLLAVSVPLGAAVYDGALLVLFLGVVAQASALPVALLRPWAAALLSIAGAVIVMASAHAGSAPWPWSVTTMVAQSLTLALLGYRGSWQLGAGTLIVALSVSGVVAPLAGQARDQQMVATNLVVFASVGGTGLIGGIVAREWQAIRRQLARERRLTEDERARRLLAEEKTRIARELHDVIAHSMSIITVQATSASARHPGTSHALRQEFDEIAASSRRALAEMRSLLGVLRDPDAPAPRAPAPRLSDVPGLVDQSRRSGLSVRLTGGGALIDDGLDEAVGVAGYRIVQEALSNVIRHAPGATAEILIRRGADLEIVVTNPAIPASIPSTPAEERSDDDGSGLRGMRERAAAVGGTISHGLARDGGYEVHLTLPLRLRPPDAEETNG